MFDHASDGYNYADFIMRREMPLFETFRERMHVGESAPDFELIRLDDETPVRLSDHWLDGALVIEFGSFT
jgi:hypothetical protein